MTYFTNHGNRTLVDWLNKYSLDPWSDTGQEFIWNRSGGRSYILRPPFVNTILSVDKNIRIICNAGHLGQVNRHRIHGYPADYSSHCAINQDATFIRQAQRNAIMIAYRYYSYPEPLAG